MIPSKEVLAEELKNIWRLNSHKTLRVSWLKLASYVRHLIEIEVASELKRLRKEDRDA